MTKVLIITGDQIGVKMAGPAIRAWNIALTLSAEHEVILVTTSALGDVEAPFGLRQINARDEKGFGRVEAWADVILFQGHAMAMFRGLRRTRKIMVVDVYDPMHLEQLEQARGLPLAAWKRRVDDATWVLNEQLSSGDYFLCASERQRLLYIGQLGALGRVNPDTYASDPNLTSLLDIASFGISATPPEHTSAVLKGVVPGIGPDDQVLLWGGGLYNWFDPATLIRAVDLLSQRRPNVRLFFQGTKHPGVPEMEIVQESRELARGLGVLDTAVFFNDSWVDFTDRQNYLLEANAGVSTHRVHVETTFSFRTRILDYLWAGLPMVVTEGDNFADLVTQHELGIVVLENDVEGLAAALERTLFDAEFNERVRRNVAGFRERFYWDLTLDPLIRFMRNPHRAADRPAGRRSPRSASINAIRDLRPVRSSKLGNELSAVARTMREGGPRLVWHKVVRRLRRHW